MAEKFDLVVIGSGPGGYVAAIRAGQLGLRTAIVEKDTRLGGTCLLRGCIPTKSMLESAAIADKARHAEDFGILVGDVRVDLKGVLKRKNRVVKSNAGGVAFLMKKNKVTVYNGFGVVSGLGQVTVKQGDAETVLETRNVLLATGSVPRNLPFIEIDGKQIVTSDELLDLATMPSHLLVLGAGAVGVEFASIYCSFGSDVTVVELADRLVPNEDAEVSAEFAKAFKRRGIKTHVGTKITAVERTKKGVTATLEDAKGKKTAMSGSHLLVAVGRAPVTEGLGLEALGIELERGFIKVDGYYRTAAAGVYAIGDIVAGTPQLAHAASSEGVTAVEHMAGMEPPTIDYRQCPGCTYSNPEIGSMGLTEQQAKDAGHILKIGKFPFSAVGKAKVIGDTTGFVKIVAEAKYNEILGVHIIGPHATDLIAEVGPLLRLECTLEELARTIHAHPTLAEAVHEAAHAALGHALHI